MRYLFLLCIFLWGCETQNPITEMGNPTIIVPISTKTRGAVSALGETAISLVSFKTTSRMLKDATNENSETGIELSCKTNANGSQNICLCPEGGEVSYNTPQTSYYDNGAFSSYHETFATTYNNCGVPSCGSQVTLDGTLITITSGTYNKYTGENTLIVQYSTSNACDGLVVNKSHLGFQVSFAFFFAEDSFANTEPHTFGSYCEENDALISFDNLEELDLLTDPTDSCQDLSHVLGI